MVCVFSDPVLWTSIQIPGAVPIGLASGSLPAGNSACTRLRSGIARPRCWKNRSMNSSDGSWSTSSTPASCARASRVRSSSVGPSPPVISTMSARSAAMRNAWTFSSRSSATVVCQWTGMPSSASSRLSHWLLVSSFCPLVSSVPMAMISAFMAGWSMVQMDEVSRNRTEEIRLHTLRRR